MISRNTVIMIICILLIVVAIIQGKFKKPKRIMEIEKEEKDKKARYSHVIENVLYIEGYNGNIEETCGDIGIRDDFIIFFKDVIVKNEGWDVETRDEKILVHINGIQYVTFENGKTINEMPNKKLEEKGTYLVLHQINNKIIFKVCDEVNKDFIAYVSQIQENNKSVC